MSLVTPAVLPSSRKDLEEKLSLFASIPQVTRVQIDVVDDRFADSPSWPYSSPGALSEMVRKKEVLPHLDHIEYEVDLMCEDAEVAAGQWLALGASRLTFHTANAAGLPHLLTHMRRKYAADTDFAPTLISFGLAVDIDTDPDTIEPCLTEVEYVQFMGIAHIGKQGEPLDPRVLEKLGTFHERHPAVPLQIDGGVSLENAKKLMACGASNLVVGSAILKSKDPIATVAAFEALKSPYGV